MRPAPPVRSFVTFAALLCLGGTLASCRPGTAVHARYNNFRAYYNTYYNAERSLEEGEAALERQAVTVDRNQLVAVFPVTAAAQTRGPFQDAIAKSAELLRTRPNSKWADDALLLIGKAYFYQQNRVGAEQKFREAMAAAALAEDRRLADEARFWLGRTYAAADRFDEGVVVLEEGLREDDGDPYWTARMRLALGELYARASRWDEAAEALRRGAPEEDDADVAARAYVLLGQVEEHAGRWDEAVAAYAEALDRKPAYELGYAAQIGRALVLGLDAGRAAEGLEIVRRMRGDDKNYDRRGELALVEARLRAAVGEEARALRLFRGVLYDETLAGAQVSGEAHYRLAEFYRDARGDYVRAAAHFDTAATALRVPPGDVRPARGAILGVAGDAQAYGALADAARRLAEADSLLALGALSDEAFEARIDEIEAARRRAFREQERRLQQTRTDQEFRGGGITRLEDTPAGGAQNGGVAATATTEGGFLNYRRPSSLQAGLVAFQQVWGDRPLVPNWRRAAAIQAGDVAAARGVVGDEIDGGFGIGDGPPPLDLTAVPRTPEKRSELVTELAGLRYELANAFFLSLGRADTAAALYRSILDETPALPVAVRARYALAEIEWEAGRADAARPLYEAVAAADSGAIGRASRARLGLEEAAAGADAAAPDDTAYVAARRQWHDGAPLSAAEAFVTLADADPDAEIAPRAYLAAAAAYADWAGADSTALGRPLPARLASTVLRPIADSLAREATARAVVAADSAEGQAVESAAAVPADSSAAPLAAPLAATPEESVVVSADSARTPVPSRGVGSGEEAAIEPALAARPQPDPAPEPALIGEAGPASSPDPPFTLASHLQALAVRYSSSPPAERARQWARALAGPVDASPDSSQAAPETLAPPLAAADSAATPRLALGGEGQQNADEARPGEEVPDDALSFDDPLDVPGLRGPEPVDPAAGGFTWRVMTLSIPDEGESTAAILAEAGFRVGLLMEEATGAYILGIGQFETAVLAEAARMGVPAWARLRGDVVDLDAYVEAMPEVEGTDGAP